MAVDLSIAAFFPDRPPTWTEVILAVGVATVTLPETFAASAVSWPTFGGGALLTGLALGAVSATASGRRFRRWLRTIDPMVRAVGIIGLLVACSIPIWLELLSPSLLIDVASGALAATIVYMFAHLAWAQSIAGWIPDHSETN